MPRVVGGRPPLTPEIRAQNDPPPIEHHNLNQYQLIVPQPWELAKKVQLALTEVDHALSHEP